MVAGSIPARPTNKDRGQLHIAVDPFTKDKHKAKDKEPALNCAPNAEAAPGRPTAPPAKNSSVTPRPIRRLVIASLSQMTLVFVP